MKTKNISSLCLIHLSEIECIAARGGDGNLDNQIVKYVGFGLGYGAKKFLNALKFLSKNLYESQSRSMVIYK